MLRFDNLGLGDSEGDWSDGSFSHKVADTVRAVEFMNSEGREVCLLVGHSFGGSAVIAAAHDCPTVKAVATVAAPYDPAHVERIYDAVVERIEAEGEAQFRIGGKALTHCLETEHGEFLVEAGPDSFLAAKPWALSLATSLGLEDELLPINQMARPVSVVKHGQLIRMPLGLTLAAPSLLKPFARSPLLSPTGRARALREPHAPIRTSDGDETVGAFIRRRLGQEMLDWVADWVKNERESFNKPTKFEVRDGAF